MNPVEELRDIMELFRVLEENGVDWEDYQLPIHDKAAGRNLARYLKMGCPEIKNGLAEKGPSFDYTLAREILGDDFIAPGEITGLAYGYDQLAHLADTLPSRDVLCWLRDNNYILIAGPPREMTLLNVCSIYIDLIFPKEEYPWYAERKERFAREDKVGCEWLMIRKGAVPGSTAKGWSQQERIITSMCYVPNVPEVVWAAVVYKRVRDRWILSDASLRTSSVNSHGFHVLMRSLSHVGGVSIFVHHYDEHEDGRTGIASARKRLQ